MSAFIVLEGIDGCGSTTQAKRLVHALRERGHAARLTCEPSDGPVGQLIRRVLEGRLADRPDGLPWATMALLFAADRLDHVRAEIEPALAEGAFVISDRYDLSSLAYQSVTSSAETDAVAWIQQLNGRARRPDLTVVIDVPWDVAEQRRAARGGTEELFEKRELQKRLADVYREAERLVGDRLEHVSGEGTADQVEARILAAVQRVFPL